MSTPALSAYIRHLTFEQKQNCIGGFILTASHNPGGIKNDFGIKFNGPNGSPALEELTNCIYDLTTKINEYKICSENLRVEKNILFFIYKY